MMREPTVHRSQFQILIKAFSEIAAARRDLGALVGTEVACDYVDQALCAVSRAIALECEPRFIEVGAADDGMKGAK